MYKPTNLPKIDKIALMLCLAFAGIAILYASVTPAFESPDEASHFLYIHNLLETRQLPILEDRARVFESQSLQRHHPPLYYLFGSLLISGTQRSDLPDYLHENPLASTGVVSDNNHNVYLHPVPTPSGDTATAIWILRLYSIALSTATVWLIYRCVSTMTENKQVGFTAALLVLSIPTFVHISASINNDNLVTFLHAAGIYVCLRIWRSHQITVPTSITMGVILGAVALAKINGLTLFPIVYGWVFLGLLTKRFRWQQAGRFIIISSLIAAACAGWWYLRNLQLYGDPLAMAATAVIWGRGANPQPISLFEAKGIWESFWFILGSFNIRGPGWLYEIYLPAITVAGLAGLFRAIQRKKLLRLYLFMMTAIAILSITALVVATSRINVSQGRILFPGMVAFSALYAVGLTHALGHKWGTLAVIPLTGLAIVTPFMFIQPAFISAEIVDTVPTSAIPVHIATPHLTVLAYEVLTDRVSNDDWVRMNFYMRGIDPGNAYFFVQALYPLNKDVLGGVDEYPGMMPTSSMQENAIYRVPVQFRLDPVKSNTYPRPYQTELVFGWRSLTADGQIGGEYVPLTQQDGTAIQTPLLGGPSVLNIQAAPPPQYVTDVVFGESIHLGGYSISSQNVSAGDTVAITFNWEYRQPIHEDWSLAFGLLDPNGELVITADGQIAGYPTSAWHLSPPFADHRSLSIPVDAPPGNYSLYVGWYRPANGERLTAEGSGVANNLYFFSQPLTITAGLD